MLELHIWGPAFGLPSIDVECLATVLYMRNVSKNDTWCLIPSSNPNLNPFRQLPALRDDSTWVAGFEQIQQYLSSHADSTIRLDHDLSDEQKAESNAYTAFLYSRGLPLLDLSLYVSTDNYTSRTRSALGDLLKWPQSWIIPHQLREQAKVRSEHLGLNALDVDNTQEEASEDTGLTAKIPKSLRKPRKTVSGLLSQSAQQTRFRLDAAIEDFLEPLNEKLAEKEWLVAGQISSTDCVAIAILSLMQAPEMPQPFLQEMLSNKYAVLDTWAKQHASTAFGQATVTTSAPTDDSARNSLPWMKPPVLSWGESSVLAMEAVVSSVPLLRSGYRRLETPLQKTDPKSGLRQKQETYTKMRGQQQLYSKVLTASISTTSLLGWLVYAGVLVLPRFGRTQPSRRSFGEAGAILGL